MSFPISAAVTMTRPEHRPAASAPTAFAELARASDRHATAVNTAYIPSKQQCQFTLSGFSMTYLSGVGRLLPGGRWLGSWPGEDVEVAGCAGLLSDAVRGDAAGGAVARDLTDRVSAMSRRSRPAAAPAGDVVVAAPASDRQAGQQPAAPVDHSTGCGASLI